MPTEMNLFGDKAAHSSSSVITLYHGSPIKSFTPTYGLGKDNHDYGRGFYLTPNVELAKEWAAGAVDGISKECWVHSYTLDTGALEILDFETKDAIYWIAELLKHRSPEDVGRRSFVRRELIAQYGVDTRQYDVIKGWRADDSYFRIASRFLSDDICVSDLSRLLRLGKLGMQYCLKTKLAYERLTEVEVVKVDYALYRKKYEHRDVQARSLFDDYARTHNYSRGKGLYCSDILGGGLR